MELDESRYSFLEESFGEEDKSDSYDSSLTNEDTTADDEGNY